MRTRVIAVALMLGVVGGLIGPLTGGGGAEARRRRTNKTTCIVDPLAFNGSTILVSNPGSKSASASVTGYLADGTLVVGDPVTLTLGPRSSDRVPYGPGAALVFITSKQRVLVDAFSTDLSGARQTRCA